MTDFQSYDSAVHKLTIEQKEYAAKVLNETDENRENAIAEIKRWIQENDLRARTAYWKKAIEGNRDWIVDDEKYKPIS